MGLSLCSTRIIGGSAGEAPSVKAAAEYSGCNEQYLRRLLRAGRLEGVKIGQVWLIKRMRLFGQHNGGNADSLPDSPPGPCWISMVLS